MGIFDFTCFAALGEAVCEPVREVRAFRHAQGAWFVETQYAASLLFAAPARLGSACHQALERINVSLIVARLIDRSLSDERRLCNTGIVQQSPKGFKSDLALADVLVTVEPGCPCRFGIVAMPHRNVL